MDKRPDPQQQLRDRDNKVYNSKAEVKAKEMKELTGSPQIDPLSRKMAEVITQRELAALGIQPEPVIKKPTFTIPKPKPIEVPAPKVAKFEETDLALETRLEEPEPNPVPELQDPKEKTPEPGMMSPNIIEAAPSTAAKDPEVPEKTDDMLNNIEHIQAFQAELHREYPELALNDDAEGSSFHTNELNEYEEDCKDLSVEQETKQVEEKLAEEKGEIQDFKDAHGMKLAEVASNKTEYEQLEHQKTDPRKQEGLKVVKTSLSTANREENRRTVKKESREVSIGLLGYKEKSEAIKTASKTPGRVRSSVEDSVLKNSLFGKPSVAKYTPRCHINLVNFKSSPIFYSLLVPPEAKMKWEHGFASAASLRHFLLKNLPEKIPEPQDIYAKSQLWLKEKEERLRLIRESEKDKEMDQCTFDPYFEVHEAQRKKVEPFLYRATIRPDIQKEERNNEFVIKIPENTLKYESLSPADHIVRYSQGFNLKKLLQDGKMMINYRSVNTLK